MKRNEPKWVQSINQHCELHIWHAPILRHLENAHEGSDDRND